MGHRRWIPLFAAFFVFVSLPNEASAISRCGQYQKYRNYPGAKALDLVWTKVLKQPSLIHDPQNPVFGPRNEAIDPLKVDRYKAMYLSQWGAKALTEKVAELKLDDIHKVIALVEVIAIKNKFDLNVHYRMMGREQVVRSSGLEKALESIYERGQITISEMHNVFLNLWIKSHSPPGFGPRVLKFLGRFGMQHYVLSRFTRNIQLIGPFEAAQAMGLMREPGWREKWNQFKVNQPMLYHLGASLAWNALFNGMIQYANPGLPLFLLHIPRVGLVKYGRHRDVIVNGIKNDLSPKEIYQQIHWSSKWGARAEKFWTYGRYPIVWGLQLLFFLNSYVSIFPWEPDMTVDAPDLSDPANMFDLEDYMDPELIEK